MQFTTAVSKSSCDAVHDSALIFLSFQIFHAISFVDPSFTTLFYLCQDLKQPYHLLNKNNEELKRLAAVESLMEVSAEGNVSKFFDFCLVTLSILVSNCRTTAFRRLSVFEMLNTQKTASVN